ncbi:hypothetical protein V5799_032007 [Amblyomma americanum]|uniref:Serine carboxypeptidase n=1 Tax=Amblyomma americanum TaxID=6943 RepID=A0AAQ4DSF9_AMBAM
MLKQQKRSHNNKKRLCNKYPSEHLDSEVGLPSLTMGLAGLWTCLVLAGSVCLASGDHQTQEHEAQQELQKLSFPDPEPLFLTPLIENCSYDEAKSKSKVDIFKTVNVTADAYSGYITVNGEKENNLFFLFIEAENNDTNAPLMLWTPGGPGLSALFAMLLQNGPVQFNQYGNFSRRELTIQKNMSVIYLDAPVGAGLSFTNNSGYATEMKNITNDILEFLKQFLQLFGKYRGRDFYAGGDSYAARYSVALAYEMLKNETAVDLKFQGIIGGVGFLAPVFDLADSSDFLLQTSMLNKTGYQIFKNQFSIMRMLAVQNNITAVYMLLQTIFSYEPPETKKTLFQQLTLYNSHASPLYTERPQSMLWSAYCAARPEFKAAIHAGANRTIEHANRTLLEKLIVDWMVDITEKVEYVLNHTRVLFYTGQLDALFPSANSQAYFERLNWTHSEKYRNANRTLWRPYGSVLKPYDLPISAAGYTKSAGNFTSAVVLGMGHYAGFDKPDEIYHLIMQFLARDISFSSQ